MRLFSLKHLVSTHHISTKLLMLWTPLFFCQWPLQPLGCKVLLHGMRLEDLVCMLDDLGGLKAKEVARATLFILETQRKPAQWKDGLEFSTIKRSMHQGTPFGDFRKSFPQRGQVSISKSLLVGKQSSRTYRQPYNKLALLQELWKVSFALS